MIVCPDCGNEIPAADFNVATDLAYCRKCDVNHAYSELVESPAVPEFNRMEPPRGVVVRDDGFGLVIAHHRISLVVLFLIPFTAVWSGLSMTAMVGGFLKSGFQPQLLFFLPFFLGTLGLLTLIFWLLFGRTVLRETSGELELYRGVFGIGRRQRFAPGEIDSVDEEVFTQNRGGGACQYQLVLRLKNGKKIKFGGMMREEARSYYRAYLLSRKNKSR